MFLQFVTTQKIEPLPQLDPKYVQVGYILKEVTQAVADFMAEWQEIAIAEHLGEAAFRSVK